MFHLGFARTERLKTTGLNRNPNPKTSLVYSNWSLYSNLSVKMQIEFLDQEKFL